MYILHIVIAVITMTIKMKKKIRKISVVDRFEGGNPQFL
jgi:hypothetical protein